MILSVLDFFLWVWFLVSDPCGQRKCLIWFQFSWTCWGLFCVLSSGPFWKCSMCIWKECVFCFLGWKALYTSVKSISSRALFNATISLLIFCLEDLSILDSGVLKSPTIIVLLSISFLKSSKILFMYLGVPMLGAYIFTMFMSSWWILPLCIMKWPSGSLFTALL